jgi:hypothetical protein
MGGVMKKLDIIGLKYVAIGFACLVIALAVLRALGRDDIAPMVTGAVLLSVLVAATCQTRGRQTPDL